MGARGAAPWCCHQVGQNLYLLTKALVLEQAPLPASCRATWVSDGYPADERRAMIQEASSEDATPGGGTC
jgi:hypothetical protein